MFERFTKLEDTEADSIFRSTSDRKNPLLRCNNALSCDVIMPFVMLQQCPFLRCNKALSCGAQTIVY